MRCSHQAASLQRAAALHAYIGICQLCRARRPCDPRLVSALPFWACHSCVGLALRLNFPGVLHSTQRFEANITAGVIYTLSLQAGPSGSNVITHLLRSRRSRGEYADACG